MSKKQKLVLLILLVIFLTPPLQHRNETWLELRSWESWQLGNFHHQKFYYCYNVIPLPGNRYSYDSLFIEFMLQKDYCPEEQYDKWNFSINVPIDEDISFWGLFYIAIHKHTDDSMSTWTCFLDGHFGDCAEWKRD